MHTRLFTLSVVLADRTVSVTRHVSGDTHSNSVSRHTMQVYRHGQARLPRFTHPPTAVLGRFMHVTPNNSQRRGLCLVRGYIYQASAVRRDHNHPAGCHFKFGSHGNKYRLGGTIFCAGIVPMYEINVSIIVRSGSRLLLRRQMNAAFIPFFNNGGRTSIVVNLRCQRRGPYLEFKAIVNLAR